MKKAPTPAEMSKGKVTAQTTPQKSSITQRLQTHLGQSVVWNAKLTETQIFGELSIEIESSLFN